MSYHADHLAWQQRVNLELNAHRRCFDKILTSNQGGTIPSSMYDAVSTYLNNDPMRTSTSSVQVRKQLMQYNQQPFTVKNKQTYTFGGQTNIKKFKGDGTASNQSNYNNPVLQHPLNYNSTTIQYPATKDVDTLSRASGAYIGRSKVVHRAKSSHHPNKTSLAQPSNPMKVYLPTEYFKHAGYIAQDQRSQAGDSVVPERFNEQLQYPPSQQKNIRQADDTKSVYSKRPVSTKHENQQQRAQSSYVKKRIFDRLDQMDDKHLEKADINLNLDDRLDDNASVITQDKLKKFNEIYGFDHGPAVQNNEDNDELAKDDQSNPNQGGEEERDEVHSLRLKDKLQFNKGKDGDTKSVISGVRSVRSHRTVVSANGSIKTSKTYISQLEKQLNDEKKARERLEKEVEEIKKINSEISSKLGLSVK